MATPRAPTGAEASAWMRDERIKAMKQDEESVKAMRELLSPEDAARFDVHNRSRPIMTSTTAVKPVAPSTVPSAISATQVPAVPATPNAVEPKK